MRRGAPGQRTVAADDALPAGTVDISEYNIPEGARGDYRINAKELEFSEQLIETMSTEWKPDEYQDQFRERLQKVIKDRMQAHGVVKHAEEEHEAGEGAATNVVDFMSLLQQSIDRNKRTPRRRGTAATTAAKVPAKKGVARKGRSRRRRRRQGGAAQVRIRGRKCFAAAAHEPAGIRAQAPLRTHARAAGAISASPASARFSWSNCTTPGPAITTSALKWMAR